MCLLWENKAIPLVRFYDDSAIGHDFLLYGLTLSRFLNTC